MPLEAVNSPANIFGVLNGGVTSVRSSLQLNQGNFQKNAIQSIQSGFASRIDEARSKLNDTEANPKIDALRHEQALLLSRKTRVNEAIEVLNKTLTQTKFLQNAIKHLEDQIKSFENSEITASVLATDWDNTLRKINLIVEDATVSYKDGGISFEKNLIRSSSRTSFQTQTFLAPYNSKGETLQIDGKYLGVDYFLQEFNLDTTFNGSPFNFVGDTFWNSDTASLDTEAATGTLTEFASQAGFPDSPTGVTASVTSASGVGFFNLIRIANGNFSFFGTTGGGLSAATITTGGLGLLDAWMYNDFNDTDDTPLNRDATFTRQFAKDDLEQALGKIHLAEAQFRLDLKTLQTRTTLFDSSVVGLDREIDQIVSTSLSEKEARLRALELEFQVAQFDFTLLSARGNTLIFSLLLSQDSIDGGPGSSFNATGEAILGSILTVQL